MIEVRETPQYEKWRKRLKDRKARALIASRIARLAYGHTGDVAPIGQGLSELRIHYGPGYRVYFQRRGDRIVLLLCGGGKGSQERDIRTAMRLAEEWDD